MNVGVILICSEMRGLLLAGASVLKEKSPPEQNLPETENFGGSKPNAV